MTNDTAAPAWAAGQPIRFTFDPVPLRQQLAYRGVAVGTTWNGFDNVRCSAATLAQIIADMKADPDSGFDAEQEAQLRELPVDAAGYVDLSGGWTTIICPDVSIWESINPTDVRHEGSVHVGGWDPGHADTVEYRVFGGAGVDPRRDPYTQGFVVEVWESCQRLPGETGPFYYVLNSNDEQVFTDWDEARDYAALAMYRMNGRHAPFGPRWLQSFNGFDHGDACAKLLAAGFVDVSWHNDACPSFTRDGLRVFVDWRDPKVRELGQGHAPFTLSFEDDLDGDVPLRHLASLYAAADVIALTDAVKRGELAPDSSADDVAGALGGDAPGTGTRRALEVAYAALAGREEQAAANARAVVRTLLEQAGCREAAGSDAGDLLTDLCDVIVFG